MAFAHLAAEMENAVRNGVFPGAVLLVREADDLRYHRAFGHRCLEPKPEPMTEDTVFDVSSLTKACVTAVAVMQLVADERLRLDDPVVRYIAGFAGPMKDRVTLRHLLSHASGLPAWIPFFEQFRGSDPPARIASREARAYVHAAAVATPLDRAPGEAAVYSDLGFILLGHIVERVSGMRLDHFAAERIFAPLDLGSSRFVDISATDGPEAWAGPVAPTERCPWRGHILRGEVHDDNAFVMGGIAGHAGLFTSARDLDILVTHLRDMHCGRIADGIVQTDVLREFWSPAHTAPGSTWCLGWDTPSPVNSAAGHGFGPHTVGHLGFTGVSVWLDLDRALHVILLSNRVHPSRQNEAIRAFRPQIHDAVTGS